MTYTTKFLALKSINWYKFYSNPDVALGDCPSAVVNFSQIKWPSFSDGSLSSKTCSENSESSASKPFRSSNLDNFGTDQLSEIKAKNTNSASQLCESSTDNNFAEELAKLKVLVEKIPEFIQYDKTSDRKCWVVLRTICLKLCYPHAFYVMTQSDGSSQKQHTVTLKINDVVVGKLTNVSKKQLKMKVAKQAVIRLFSPTIRIVSDGENLILKDEDSVVKGATTTEQCNEKPLVSIGNSMRKDSQPMLFQLDGPMLKSNFHIFNNTAICSSVSPIPVPSSLAQFCCNKQLNSSSLTYNLGTNQSSENKVENIYSSSWPNEPSTHNVFAEKLAKLKLIAGKIPKFILYGENSESKCFGAMHKNCERLGYSRKFHMTTHSDVYRKRHCTVVLKINDVIVGKLTQISKKRLKMKVAKQALGRLFNPMVSIVSDGENLILKEDGVSVVKGTVITEQSNAKSLLPVDYSMKKDGQPILFQLDPMLKFNFCIFDNTTICSSSSPVSLLINSAQFCKIPIHFEFSNDDDGLPDLHNVCEVFLGGHKICQAAAYSRDKAMSLAASAALDSLSRVVYTIKVKNDNPDELIVPRDEFLDCPDSSTILTETNIGYKMLKMMGWSGGGIGKEGNIGIFEPLKIPSINLRGHGFGYFAENKKQIRLNSDGKLRAKLIRAKIKCRLRDYLRSNSIKRLVFFTDFFPEEKRLIHKISRKYEFKSYSRNVGPDHCLTIGRIFTWTDLLGNLKEVGGSTEKYELITPEQYIEETQRNASA